MTSSWTAWEAVELKARYDYGHPISPTYGACFGAGIFFCSRSEWQFSQTLCFSRMQSLASSLNRSWTAESRANQRSVDHLSSTSAAWAGTRRPRPLSRVLSDLESLKDKEQRCVSEYKGLLFFTNDSQDVITYFFPQDKRVFQTTQRLSTLTRYAIYAGHASEVVMSD